MSADIRQPLAAKLAFSLLVLLAATGFIAVVLVQSEQPRDFIIFYTAGKILKDGQGERLYDSRLQESIIRSLVNISGPDLVQNVLLRFNHPPFEAALFLPVAYLPYKTAFVVWEIIQLICFGASLYLLREYFARSNLWGRLALTGAMLFPAISTLAYGQETALVLLCLVAAFRLLQAEKDLLSGCFLGLALIKFQLILPILLVFAMRRKWKVVVGAAVLGAVEVAISFWAVGRDVISSYLAMSQYSAKVIDAFLVAGMPSVRGILYAVLAGRVNQRVIEGLALFGSLAVIGLVVRYGPRRVDLLLAAAISISPLVTFHSLCPDLLVLLLPAVLVAARASDWTAPAVLSLIFVASAAANFAGGQWEFVLLPCLLLTVLLARRAIGAERLEAPAVVARVAS